MHLQVIGDPVPMPRARVVRGKSGAVHAFTPEEAVKAKKRIRAAAELVRFPYFVGPIQMEIDVFLPRDGITFWKRGSGDCDNFFKLVADALEGIAYANDAAIWVMRVRKQPTAIGSPRLDILIHGEIGVRPGNKPKAAKVSKLYAVPATYRRSI